MKTKNPKPLPKGIISKTLSEEMDKANKEPLDLMQIEGFVLMPARTYFPAEAVSSAPQA